MTKGYTIRGLDGAWLRVEETEEEDMMVLSIRRGTVNPAVETIRLGHKEWEELMGLRFNLTVSDVPPPAPPV